MLSSELAADARAAGVVVEPSWANGAKIFTHISSDDLPAEIDLRPYHVVVNEEDVPRFHTILKNRLSCKQRPLVKSSQTVALRQDLQHIENEQMPTFVIENTFYYLPEPRWITSCSECTRSLNDADVQHVNPRSHMLSLEEDLAKLKACHKRLDLPGAVQCYSTIKGKVGTPNVQILTLLIDICGKIGALEDAQRWAQQVMIDEYGLKPSRITLNCLINGCAKAGDISGALQWFQVMKDYSMAPDSMTYNCMIRAFASRGSTQQAESFFEEAKSKPYTFDQNTYRIMMELYASQGVHDKVEDCFSQMQQAGFAINRHSFNIMISAYTVVRDLDSANSWCKKANDAGFSPQVEEYTRLLKACSPIDGTPAKPDQAREIL